MNQKVSTSEGDGEKLGLGRRISEILDDKGKAYTVPAFSKRIGMSESTLYRCLNEGRYISPSKLKDIAKGLDLTSDRLKQIDTEKKMSELGILVKKRMNFRRALQVANELAPIAVGHTEKFDILNNMGAAHYYSKQYDLAHVAWLQALPHAERLNDKFGDNERLYKVTKNLCLTYTVRKDFLSLIKLLDKVEPSFEKSNHDRAGTLSLYYAMYAYKMGSMEQYREKMYHSLEHFQKTGDGLLVARAIHNVAYVEYQMGNYQQAKELFESIIDSPYHDLEDESITIKDYAKTLLKIGEREHAIQMIATSLYQLSSSEHNEIRAKLLLLHARATDQVQSAESVLEITELSDNLYYLAVKFLMDRCMKTGNTAGLMNYYSKAEEYGRTALSSSWEEI